MLRKRTRAGVGKEESGHLFFFFIFFFFLILPGGRCERENKAKQKKIPFKSAF